MEHLSVAPDKNTEAYNAVVNNPEFQKWFQGSKVVDNKGKPIVVYHATTGSFEKFNPERGELGNHFGTLKAAEHIGIFNALMEGPEGQEKEIYVPVFLNMKKPLISRVDLSSWSDPTNVLAAIYSSGLSEKERDRFWDAGHSIPEFRRILRELGYDGIIYRNQSEDVGSISYITLNEDQAWSLYSNTVM